MRPYLLLFLLAVTGLSLHAQNLQGYFSADACTWSDAQGRFTSVRQVGGPDCDCGVSDTGWRLQGSQALTIDAGMRTVFDGDFSISFYFSPRAATDQLIMLNGPGCERDSSFSIRYDAGANRIEVLYRQDAIFFVREFIPLDRTRCWQHIVITKSREDFQFFLNGTLSSEIRSLVIDFARSDSLRIGGLSCGTFGQMDGSIDELRIYTEILTPVDVRQLFIQTDFLETNRGVVVAGEPFQANVLNSCATSFLWTPAIGVDDPTRPDASFTSDTDRRYILQLMKDGCTSFDTLDIVVVDSSAINCDELLLATAFTPNGDGLNETFGISNFFVVDNLISYKIIDRWGETLFVTDDVLDSWDATFKGSPVNSGVYIYEILYECEGERQEKIGTVAVLR